MSTELELLLGALDDTISVWEPEDAAVHILQLLRRNLIGRMRAAGAEVTDHEEDPF